MDSFLNRDAIYNIRVAVATVRHTVGSVRVANVGRVNCRWSCGRCASMD